MQKAMKRVMYCGPGVMRALALRAGQTTTIPGEKLTPAILQRYARHLIIMDGRTRHAEFIGEDVAQKYVASSLARVTDRTEKQRTQVEPEPVEQLELVVEEESVEADEKDVEPEVVEAPVDMKALSLAELSKAELVRMSEENDLPPRRSKQDLIQQLLDLDDKAE
jgi:hypothetical protein